VLVVDASVMAPAVADHGADGVAYRTRLKAHVLAAPDLLRVEVMAVIRRQADNGMLTATQAKNAVDDLLDLPLVVYPAMPLLRRCWDLRANVTAYDACYVALAEVLDAPLLTADRRLANAPGTRCRFELV
jgi:predicted nucleic acid-binding protein